MVQGIGWYKGKPILYSLGNLTMAMSLAKQSKTTHIFVRMAHWPISAESRATRRARRQRGPGIGFDSIACFAIPASSRSSPFAIFRNAARTSSLSVSPFSTRCR